MSKKEQVSDKKRKLYLEIIMRDIKDLEARGHNISAFQDDIEFIKTSDSIKKSDLYALKNKLKTAKAIYNPPSYANYNYNKYG